MTPPTAFAFFYATASERPSPWITAYVVHLDAKAIIHAVNALQRSRVRAVRLVEHVEAAEMELTNQRTRGPHIMTPRESMQPGPPGNLCQHGEISGERCLPCDESHRLITVCAACFCASCWQGIFYCEDYKHASTVEKTRAELARLALENPDYWNHD